MSDTPIKGACLCGAVEFSIIPPSLACVHCHCTMCQRNHGAGYVTWFAVPRAQFSLDRGDSTLMRYESSDHGVRSFCGRCGSSLFCESNHHPDRVDVVLANMKTPIDRSPQLHIFFDDRADWTMADDGLPRLGGATGMEPIKAQADASVTKKS
jgi:hypothetical protein